MRPRHENRHRHRVLLPNPRRNSGARTPFRERGPKDGARRPHPRPQGKRWPGLLAHPPQANRGPAKRRDPHRRLHSPALRRRHRPGVDGRRVFAQGGRRAASRALRRLACPCAPDADPTPPSAASLRLRERRDLPQLLRAQRLLLRASSLRAVVPGPARRRHRRVRGRPAWPAPILRGSLARDSQRRGRGHVQRGPAPSRVRLRCSHAGHATAIRFDWAAVATQVLRVYGEILSGGKASAA